MERKFLINTITDWNEPPRARHQVAFALAKQHKVVFVSASRTGIPGMEIVDVQESLRLINPSFPIPYKVRYRIGLLNWIYQQWLFRKLRKVHRDHIVINFDFTASLIHRFFKRTAYYCNDDHIGMSYLLNPGWVARYQDRCEQKLAKNVNFCIATSEFLASRLKSFNEHSYEIRLGAPAIDKALENSLSLRVDRKKINVGIVGYLDTIHSGMLNSLLSRDKLDLTLIGPISEKKRITIAESDRCRITGSLIGSSLYEEVGQFDVGLIPYKINTTIDRTPNKLWLYLALGIPVVISNIQGIQNWLFPDHFVYRANNNSEFYSLIKKARENDSYELMKSRIEFAKQNTWDRRMEEFMDIVDKIFQAGT